MKPVLFLLALGTSATALVCEDLSSCDGCVAKRFDENAPSCKAWGPKKCTRKDTKGEWEAEWCPAVIPGDPCEEFPGCDCVGEKANGARKCLKMPKGPGDEDQCNRKEANANNPWVTTSWCASAPPTAQPTVTPPVTNPSPAAILDCFQDPDNSDDWCGECCPACTAVDSVAEDFYAGGPNGGFYPNVQTKCVCLELAESDWSIYENGYYIRLTPFSDCVRITGNDNIVFAGFGDDAMYTNGDDNQLWAGDGDDHLAAGGSGNLFNAFPGSDTCTDLSGGLNTLDLGCY